MHVTSLARKFVAHSIFSDRRLLFSSAIVAAGFFASKVLGLAREMLIGRAFGTQGDLDAFFAATSFSDLLFSVIAGGALASVFIPVFSTHLARGKEGERAAWEFASAVVNDIFLVVTALSLLGMWLAPQIVDYVLAPGFPADRRLLAADLLRLVLISTILFGVSGTLTGILHAHNHFVLPALAPSVYNLSIIAGALVLAPRWGIYGLAYGVVAGSALHLLIQLPGLVRHRARYFATLGRRQESLLHLLDLLGPRVITMAAVRVTFVFMTNQASRLGEGSVSALSYAYSLWQFPESLIGTAIALAAFPRLAVLAAEGRSNELRNTFRMSAFSILVLAVPAACLLVAFAQPIVSLFFQRGAFGGASTELVSTVLRFYALAVIGESLLELTARIFYARHDSRTPMWVALASMALRAGLMVWWSGMAGVAGIALAYAVGVTIEGGALYWLAQPGLRSDKKAEVLPVITDS